MALHPVSLCPPANSFHKGLYRRSKSRSVHHQTCLPRNVTATAGLTESPSLNAKKLLKKGSISKEISQADLQRYRDTLHECARGRDLRRGKKFHARIVHKGFERDTSVGNHLITMYAKCGRLEEARHMFDKMSERNVITWNAMIAGYSTGGHFGKVVKLFCEMQQEQLEPNESTFVSLLRACVSSSDVEQAHALVIKTGVSLDVTVANVLVDVYSKFEDLLQARQVFDAMPQRNVVSWNSIMTGYIQNDHGDEALDILYEMCRTDVKSKLFKKVSGLIEALGFLETDSEGYGEIVQECAHIKDLRQGKRFHARIVHRGFERDTFIGNNLISMYVKYGSLVDARHVFDEMPKRNVITWNAMIAGYSTCGQFGEAVEFFCEMQQEQLKPNRSTLVNLLKACVSSADVEQVHALVIKRGSSLHVHVANILVDIYTKCGGLLQALQVFDAMPQRKFVS